MITEIQIDRSRILKGVRVPVRERFSVVVGPNGSGKTTLLRSIHKVTVRKPLGITSFEGTVAIDFSKMPSESNELLMGWRRGQVVATVPEHFVRRRSDGVAVDEVTAAVITGFLSTRFLKLSAEVSAQVSYAETVTPSLGDQGENLASLLGWYLKTANLEVVHKITSSLKSLVPQVKRIWVGNSKLVQEETEMISVGKSRYPVSRKREYWGDQLMFDTTAKDGIPASEMSEGTLLATALLTLLHGENPPNLLLLDDIDKGLHPRAINSLVEILRGLMAQRPELQIIATTHSPYLLDQIPVESVICMHVGDDGFAKAKLLSDHPEYENWKDTMTAGEFWSVMGEAWVTQDVKAATT